MDTQQDTCLNQELSAKKKSPRQASAFSNQQGLGVGTYYTFNLQGFESNTINKPRIGTRYTTVIVVV